MHLNEVYFFLHVYISKYSCVPLLNILFFR